VVVPRALAQSASSAPRQKPQAAPARDDDDDDEKPQLASNSSVPPTAAVITIKGLCDTPKAGAAKSECKTVVTRAEFERLANALQPNMSPPVRKQLASAYPRYILMAKEAQKLGLDKDPHYIETLKFAKLQILNQEMTRHLQAEAAKVPPSEIESYYKTNAPAFEEASVQRVFVPRTRKIDTKDNSGDEYKAKVKEAEEAMSKEADDLHAKAVAGENFDKLQKDAYDAAGISSNPPPTSIPKVRRSNLPPSHVAVLDLKPGEVSPVIHDPSGSFFYKLQSKQMLPLSEAEAEIKSTLQSQRMREMQQKLQASITTDLNDSYFNAPTPPAAKSGDAEDNAQAKPATQK